MLRDSATQFSSAIFNASLKRINQLIILLSAPYRSSKISGKHTSVKFKYSWNINNKKWDKIEPMWDSCGTPKPSQST